MLRPKFSSLAAVLEHFKKNSVEVVHLIGRRGPVQAAYTPKELREVLSRENL